MQFCADNTYGLRRVKAGLEPIAHDGPAGGA